MSKKLLRVISIGIGISLMLVLGGSFTLASKQELTPSEWSQLGWEEKIKAKTIEIRSYMWTPSWIEEKNLPTDVTGVREKVHSGDLSTPLAWYNIALFETAHPKVYIKPTTFNPWIPESATDLMAKMAAGNAPSIYQLLVPRVAISEGLSADITDLVRKNWDLFGKQIIPIWKTIGWEKDHCYILPRNYTPTPALVYRKDYFEEGGIFNEKGVPGPPENWTWQEFRTIAKKLSDPKKQRWGAASNTLDTIRVNFDLVTLYAVTHGWPITNLTGTTAWLFPNKTGKSTYAFGYIKPIAEGIKFFNEMRWKDNSLLIGEKSNGLQEFNSGRVAMRYFSYKYDVVSSCMYTPHKFDPVKESKDILGMALSPTTKYKLRPKCLRFSPLMFDVTLDKEQLEAAFNWAIWNLCGTGFENSLVSTFQGMQLGLPTGGWETYVLLTTPYKVEKGPYANKIVDIAREKFPGVLKNFEEIHAKNNLFPYFPSPKEYGLEVRNASEIQKLENALRIALLMEEKISMDTIKKEMEKTAQKINTKLVNYKIKGDVERWEAYFKVIDKLYKENYPEFYGSKDYEENFANYFKL